MASNDRLVDIEFTDPQAMRALAHPVRLTILLCRGKNHGAARFNEQSHRLAPEV